MLDRSATQSRGAELFPGYASPLGQRDPDDLRLTRASDLFWAPNRPRDRRLGAANVYVTVSAPSRGGRPRLGAVTRSERVGIVVHGPEYPSALPRSNRRTPNCCSTETSEAESLHNRGAPRRAG